MTTTVVAVPPWTGSLVGSRCSSRAQNAWPRRVLYGTVRRVTRRVRADVGAVGRRAVGVGSCGGWSTRGGRSATGPAVASGTRIRMVVVPSPFDRVVRRWSCGPGVPRPRAVCVPGPRRPRGRRRRGSDGPRLRSSRGANVAACSTSTRSACGRAMSGVISSGRSSNARAMTSACAVDTSPAANPAASTVQRRSSDRASARSRRAGLRSTRVSRWHQAATSRSPALLGHLVRHRHQPQPGGRHPDSRPRQLHQRGGLLGRGEVQQLDRIHLVQRGRDRLATLLDQVSASSCQPPADPPCAASRGGIGCVPSSLLEHVFECHAQMGTFRARSWLAAQPVDSAYLSAGRARSAHPTARKCPLDAPNAARKCPLGAPSRRKCPREPHSRTSSTSHSPSTSRSTTRRVDGRSSGSGITVPPSTASAPAHPVRDAHVDGRPPTTSRTSRASTWVSQPAHGQPAVDVRRQHPRVGTPAARPLDVQPHAGASTSPAAHARARRASQSARTAARPVERGDHRPRPRRRPGPAAARPAPPCRARRAA